MRSKGEGHIRRRKDGRWEAQITVGTDPGTGKPVRRSLYGKTQKEVKEKMRVALNDIADGTYRDPSRLTVGEWMRIWLQDYTGHLKPRTKTMYAGYINNHIIPLLGKAKLQQLRVHNIQRAYNKMGETLSAKTVKNIHGILHKALSRAVTNGVIKVNPSDLCELPKPKKAHFEPLTGIQMADLIRTCEQDENGAIFIVALLTGLRQSELIGLTWDCVDLKAGTVHVVKQLQLVDGKGYVVTTPKHDRERKINLSPYVVEVLKKHQLSQKRKQLAAGPMWSNPEGYVFTDNIGDHLKRHTIYKRFKRLAEKIGCPDARFHDLRHTYAVASLRAGDDIKTLQENLGHHTAAFTLDVYGHVTEEMREESAKRQEAFLESIGVL